MTAKPSNNARPADLFIVAVILPNWMEQWREVMVALLELHRIVRECAHSERIKLPRRLSMRRTVRSYLRLLDQMNRSPKAEVCVFCSGTRQPGSAALVHRKKLCLLYLHAAFIRFDLKSRNLWGYRVFKKTPKEIPGDSRTGPEEGGTR